MKATGIVRRIDDLGRIVIPKELRRTHDIAEGDPLEIFTEEDRIIFKKYETSRKCVFCGETDVNELIEYKGVAVCNNCSHEIEGRR